MDETHSPQLDRAESAGTLESGLGWNPGPATYLLSDPDKLLTLSKFQFPQLQNGGIFLPQQADFRNK